jgi:arabinan endo-1,5-alpha-L-arabinosidase
VNKKAHLSQSAKFLAGSEIMGELEGSWELGADGASARTTLGSIDYSGRFLRCWGYDNGMLVLAFTAMSEDGSAIWGAGVAIPELPQS